MEREWKVGCFDLMGVKGKTWVVVVKDRAAFFRRRDTHEAKNYKIK